MPTRRDNTTWIFVHDGMPDHPKIEALSDRSFRALIDLWCYCSRNRTDGYVTDTAWMKRTTPKVRRELVGAGLVDELFTPVDNSPARGRGDGSSTESRRDGVVIHDFLDWQRSASDAAQITSKKAAAGGFGNHQRWHVDQGKWSPDCKHCVDGPPGPGSHNPSQVRSHPGSHSGSQTDRTPIAEKMREESGSVGGEGSGPRGRAREAPTPHNPRCEKPCRRCQAARLAEERAAAEAEQAAAEQRAAAARAAADCPWCEGTNVRDLPPLTPTSQARAEICDHRPPIRLVEGATA